jgi:hypothetical protein
MYIFVLLYRWHVRLGEPPRVDHRDLAPFRQKQRYQPSHPGSTTVTSPPLPPTHFEMWRLVVLLYRFEVT